jgi:hypothetical protein
MTLLLWGFFLFCRFGPLRSEFVGMVVSLQAASQVVSRSEIHHVLLLQLEWQQRDTTGTTTKTHRPFWFFHFVRYERTTRTPNDTHDASAKRAPTDNPFLLVVPPVRQARHGVIIRTASHRDSHSLSFIATIFSPSLHCCQEDFRSRESSSTGGYRRCY